MFPLKGLLHIFFSLASGIRYRRREKVTTHELGAAGEETQNDSGVFFSLFQKRPFRTQLWERPNAEVHLQATWNEEEQPPLLSSFATTLGKSSRLQMHKTGKTVHSSANCPLSQGAHRRREEAHQQLATTGWAHGGLQNPALSAEAQLGAESPSRRLPAPREFSRLSALSSRGLTRLLTREVAPTLSRHLNGLI